MSAEFAMRGLRRQRVLLVGKVLVLAAFAGMTLIAFASWNKNWVFPVLAVIVFLFALALIFKPRFGEAKSRRRK